MSDRPRGGEEPAGPGQPVGPSARRAAATPSAPTDRHDQSEPSAGGAPDAGGAGGARPTPDEAPAPGESGVAAEAAPREGGPTELPSREEPPATPLLDDTAAIAAERDEYLEALQRLKADFDNYRKRVQRLQEEQAARAALDLVSKLLPVLDTLDLAEAHLRSLDNAESTQDAKALSQARGQLMDVLAKEGLERVDQTEVAFDPVVHDAVAHAPATGDEEGADGPALVDEVLRSGYRWRGQVLRAAMVRVRG